MNATILGFTRYYLPTFVVISLLGAQTARAGGVVTAADEAQLRAALQGGGLVTLAFDGTIVLTNAIVVAQPTVIDASGHTVAISGGGARRVFEVAAGSLALTNLTLVNGLGTNGGAILNNALLTAISCTFVSNRVAGLGVAGGAVYNASSANFHLCKFLNNSARAADNEWTWVGAAAYGGALYNAGSLSVSACSFHSNTCSGSVQDVSLGGAGGAPWGGVARGGALYSAQTAAVVASTFANNRAQGGNVLGDHSLSMMSATAGGAFGGAVYTGVQFSCTNNTFLSNSAMRGLVGAPLARDRDYGGAGLGGAVCAESNAVVLSFCTLAMNEAIAGRGSSFSPPPPGGGAGIFAGADAAVALAVAH